MANSLGYRGSSIQNSKGEPKIRFWDETAADEQDPGWTTKEGPSTPPSFSGSEEDWAVFSKGRYSGKPLPDDYRPYIRCFFV